MILRYPNNATLVWSLAALLPVAAWFLLTARLAILRGVDLSASADIAFAVLATAQAFVIPLFAAGHRPVMRPISRLPPPARSIPGCRSPRCSGSPARSMQRLRLRPRHCLPVSRWAACC